MQLFYYLERKKEKTNEQQTKKQKQNHLRNSVFFTTWMLFNVRDKLHKAQSLNFFFFFYSETFSLVLMQKTCFYFCYAVTMRSFSNRESRDQSSSGLHTRFLLIIIYLLILSPCHSTGSGRTYQLFLL